MLTSMQDGGNYMIDPDHWGLIARRGHGGLWRVIYGDPAVGLTDEEYLERRPWHFKAILPGHPDPDEYRIEQTNMYNIHNRCGMYPSLCLIYHLIAI